MFLKPHHLLRYVQPKLRPFFWVKFYFIFKINFSIQWIWLTEEDVQKLKIKHISISTSMDPAEIDKGQNTYLLHFKIYRLSKYVLVFIHSNLTCKYVNGSLLRLKIRQEFIVQFILKYTNTRTARAWRRFLSIISMSRVEKKT